MQIISAASAFPKHYYPQAVLLEALQAYWGTRLENPEVLRRLHRNIGVEGRYLALPVQAYPKLSSWGEVNDRWIEVAVDLGQQAICRALTYAGLAPRDLGAFFFTSVTGIASPSIDAMLINRMGLSTDIRRVPMFGLGCVAGAAGTARAADYVKAYPKQMAIVLAVELCSLTVQKEDLSPANLISSGLFGDGAAAVIVAGEECSALELDSEPRGPRILGTRSVFYPQTEAMMGWHISEKGFRIMLSPQVPELVRSHIGNDVDEFLAEHGHSRKDVGSWVLHTGGPKVLEAMQDALDLKDGQLEASWKSLKKTGNLSSASVLIVLEETMKRRRPAPGTLGVMAAMGPGFCSELLLLQW
jgi:alkylresorcinol/alkylpyrone synthase